MPTTTTQPHRDTPPAEFFHARLIANVDALLDRQIDEPTFRAVSRRTWDEIRGAGQEAEVLDIIRGELPWLKVEVR